MSETRPYEPRRGYGNIYTPHAGSMIIQVQREGGLANRTIILSERQVRLLRFVASRRGVAFAVLLIGSWLFFALQATRVPLLSRQVSTMKQDARRLDTLQTKLAELQQRYEQVQKMLGVSTPSAALLDNATAANAPRTGAAGPTGPAAPAGPAAPGGSAGPAPTVPDRWPLAVTGFITRGVGGADAYATAHTGIDVALPVGTEVRAAGAGLVVEVGSNAEYGSFVRLQHAEEYESLYGHLSEVLVTQGQRVPAGIVIALSGNTGRSTAPHLHFEVRRGGKSIDPMQLIRKRRGDGDVQQGSQRQD